MGSPQAGLPLGSVGPQANIFWGSIYTKNLSHSKLAYQHDSGSPSHGIPLRKRDSSRWETAGAWGPR